MFKETSRGPFGELRPCVVSEALRHEIGRLAQVGTPVKGAVRIAGEQVDQTLIDQLPGCRARFGSPPPEQAGSDDLYERSVVAQRSQSVGPPLHCTATLGVAENGRQPG